MQRQTTRQQRLAVAIALVGLVALSGTTIARIGAFNAQINVDDSEQTRTHQPAPAFVQRPARPY
jgi:hypothetical protein